MANKVETKNVQGSQAEPRVNESSGLTNESQVERKVVFHRLHAAATLPLYNAESGTFTLYVCDITESGRPNVIIIPAHNLSRPIFTGVAPVTLGRGMGLIVSRGASLGEGLFSPSVPVPYHDPLFVRVFNARHEPKRLIHGEAVADLVLIDGSPFAGPAEWAPDNVK